MCVCVRLFVSEWVYDCVCMHVHACVHISSMLIFTHIYIFLFSLSDSMGSFLNCDTPRHLKWIRPTCVACPAGKFKSNAGTAICIECPDDQNSTAGFTLFSSH